MKRFFDISKMEIAILGIWIIVLNYYKIFVHTIGIDTEQALVGFDENINWTLGQGRFASAFFRKILMPTGFNYEIAMVITVLGWMAVCLAYQYCFFLYSDLERWYAIVYTAVFVSCPIWTEQSYFVCSMFVNVIGLLFSVIATHLLVQCLQEKYETSKYLLAVILIILSIAIYQAYLYLFLSNCIIFLSLNANKKQYDLRRYIISGIKCVITIAFSTIIYFLISKYAVKLFFKPELSYAGYTDASGYMSGRILWFHAGVLQCLYNIKAYVLQTLDKNGLYGVSTILIVWVLVQSYYISNIRKKRDNSSIMLLCNILLLISLYSGAILMGGNVSTREQTVLPAIKGFFFVSLLNILERTCYVAKARIKQDIRKYVLVSVSLYCIMISGIKTLSINRSDNVRYNADVNYAEHVMMEIRDCVKDSENRKIVFVGQNNWTLPENYYTSDVIGHSIFSWDAEGPVGVNYRAYAFLNVCGHDYVKPSIDDVQLIFQMCKEENLFKDQKIVLYGDEFILVDLNEF